MHTLARYIGEHEHWLMERILHYAKARGYTKYTSTLVEAWRVSVRGLSEALALAADVYGGRIPEFSPEERFEADPVAAFGVAEARRHRERGVSLSMFLGLYKYYRYAFVDLVHEMPGLQERREEYARFVERVFDRIEIAFCAEWSGLEEDRAVAELQRSNRLMTNEKNKYLTLFESLDAPAFLVDEQGLVDNVNPPAARLLGLRELAGSMYYTDGPDPATEVRGTPLAQNLPWLAEHLDRILAGGEESVRTEAVQGDERGGRWYLATLSRMRDVSGKFRGAVAVLKDITARKQVEKLKEDVDRITRHDLKVPLSGMLGVVNCLLEEDGLTDEQRGLLSMARESGYNMIASINRSLDLYKMETGTYNFQPEPVDLAKILRQVIRSVSPAAANKDVPLRAMVHRTPLPEVREGPYLQAEEMLLHSALGNLLVNAVEASPDEASADMAVDVTVDVRVDLGRDCTITISNHGCVPASIRESFFDKYVTHGKKHGTGLGTYSARLMVETMRGDITLDSDESTTRIAVRLPLAGGPKPLECTP